MTSEAQVKVSAPIEQNERIWSGTVILVLLYLALYTLFVLYPITQALLQRVRLEWP